MTILTVLLLILLSMVDGTTRLWRDSERKVDSYREARAALNLISFDLASLHATSDPMFFEAATDESAIKALVSNAADADIGSALFFLTVVPPSEQDPAGKASDVCAVGYFLAFGRTSQSSSDKASYNLYRYFISSNETFKNVQACLKGSQPNPFFDGGSGRATAYIKEIEIVARNVTQFIVNVYTVSSSPTGKFDKLTEFVQSPATPLPNVLDISIVAVNEETSEIWDGVEANWKDEASTTYEQNARAFSTRIYLNAANYTNASVIR